MELTTTGKAQVREFIKYCKMFREVRIGISSRFYFKISKSEMKRFLQADMNLIVTYSYTEGDSETINIEKIK
jgi:hypothetical protein